MPESKQKGVTNQTEPPVARILSPVDGVAEVEPLVHSGAQELYGGVQPTEWGRVALSANQRTFASAHFPSEGAFAEAAAEARRLQAKLHLTLNACPYDPAAYPSLTALAERAATWGVTGVIAGDLGLLLRLRETALPFELTLSTLAGALNRSSVGFFKRFGIRRVVLPRHLTLAEMARVVSAHPDLAFEAFVLIGRCPNEEAYCTFQHTNPSQRWPCEIPYEFSVAGGEDPLPEHPAASWRASWAAADRRLACGLCGIPELLRIGVGGLKIVGRGGPLEAKLANVRLVAGFARGGRSAQEARAAYVARFGRPCHPLTCYFPELYSEG
jgi:putative protease